MPYHRDPAAHARTIRSALAPLAALLEEHGATIEVFSEEMRSGANVVMIVKARWDSATAAKVAERLMRIAVIEGGHFLQRLPDNDEVNGADYEHAFVISYPLLMRRAVA